MIIDISNEVFTAISDVLTGVECLTTYPSTEPIFPCLTFEEQTNTTSQAHIDTGGEKFNEVTIQIDIYTKGETKVSDAKTIRNTVDSIMADVYGMNRDDSKPVPNFMDSNVYRYTLRYSFTIDKNKKIYRG